MLNFFKKLKIFLIMIAAGGFLFYLGKFLYEQEIFKPLFSMPFYFHIYLAATIFALAIKNERIQILFSLTSFVVALAIHYRELIRAVIFGWLGC